MRYPGGKNSEGTWQRIVSQIPPHRVCVELFGGSAAITRRIRPAARNIVVEVDAAVIARCGERIRETGAQVIQDDAFSFLAWAPISADWFLYVDPPYHPETLASRGRYRYMLSAEQHAELLQAVTRLPAMVMLSGYRHPLYDEIVGHWRHIDFPQMTRGGTMATETLWMNYPEPEWLHDPRFVGAGYREREVRARRRRSHQRRIQRADRAELLAMFDDVAGRIAELGGGVLLADRIARALPTEAAIAPGQPGGLAVIGDGGPHR